MSPSISAQASLQSYIKTITASYNTLRAEQHQVSFSTSHSIKRWRINTPSKLEQKLTTLGFHQAGVDLGQAIRQQWQTMERPETFIIFSDKDAHSWQNFNWEFIDGEANIWYVPAGEKSSLSNVYFGKARYLAPPAARVLDWDISLKRTSTAGIHHGMLKVSNQGQALASVPWEFIPGQGETSIRVSWTAKPNQPGSSEKKKPLIWELIPAESDAILADNTFRTRASGLGKNVAILAESGGEQILESPAYNLQAAQEALGIRAERYKKISSKTGHSPERYPLWVLFVGNRQEIGSYCPDSLSDYRRQQGHKKRGKQIKIWMSPYRRGKQELRNICWCYHRLLLSPSNTSKMPPYCQEIYDPASYAEVMRSIGARQIGGEAGGMGDALAWEGEDDARILKVMAFSVALKPGQNSSLSHGSFPLLIKSLLELEGIAKGTGQPGLWPRYTDLSSLTAWKLATKGPRTEKQRIPGSNVPEAESAMKLAPEALFPPQWPGKTKPSPQHPQQQTDDFDPVPSIYALAMISLLAILAEIIFSARRRRPFNNQLPKALLYCLAHSALMARSARAEISLNLRGFGSQSQIMVHDIALQVSKRTSLSISKDVVLSDKSDPDQFEKGWIWSSGLLGLDTEHGVLRAQMASWIRRGGFLVLESAPDYKALAKLTHKGFDLLDRPGRWRPIPPDHELMRSFYLIDALPDCEGLVWYGYEYDRRLAILAIPYPFLIKLSAAGKDPAICGKILPREKQIRLFVNILMIALTTDYKKDQIHMREILKRL